MTAILKDLRSLKAARDRGEITPEQYARAEAVLLDLVEDAVLAEDPAPAPKPARRQRTCPITRRAAPAPPPKPVVEIALEPEPVPEPMATPARIWETGLLIAAGLASLTLLIAVLIGSLTLALTLLVTLIAAGSVHAVKTLDK